MNTSDGENEKTIEEICAWAYRVLTVSPIAEIPQNLKTQKAEEFYNYIVSTRKTLESFTKGDLDTDVKIKGSIGGSLKALQANLRHLSWQVKMVADGDFTQRVDFMGEFSSSFNTMITEFSHALNELKKQKELLALKTEELHEEIDTRIRTEKALKESEAQYKSLSRTDPLTELYNRRFFFEIAAKEIERSKRDGTLLAVAMLDLDHFKHYNDTFGHQGGDTCLVAIAALLRKTLRVFDITARYGGEEFVLMLSVDTERTAFDVLDRLRRVIEHYVIETQGIATNITASIGYYVFLPQSSSVSADEMLVNAIKQADDALYKAKEKRNIVHPQL